MDRISSSTYSHSLYEKLLFYSHNSVQYALIFLPGVITGRMFDIGYFKTPFVIASAALIVSTILVAECKEYWQFLLCQGIAIGVRILYNFPASAIKT